MLKISIVDTQAQHRLVLEGAIISPWAAELKVAWGKAQIEARGRKVVLDFKNVTRISAEGEEVLLELVKEGAKFYSGGVLTRHILQQLTRNEKTLRVRAASPTTKGAR